MAITSTGLAQVVSNTKARIGTVSVTGNGEMFIPVFFTIEGVGEVLTYAKVDADDLADLVDEVNAAQDEV